MSSTTDKLRTAFRHFSPGSLSAPGLVQNYGALIVTDPMLDRILAASETVEDHLGAPLADFLRMAPDAFYGRETMHLFRNLAGRPSAATSQEYAAAHTHGDTRSDVFLHRSPTGDIILEHIPTSTDIDNIMAGQEKLRQTLLSRAPDDDLEAMLQHFCDRIHHEVGLDRVTIYKFLPDGLGKVINEALAPEAPSLIGLHYPAVDLAPEAKSLYQRRPFRYIADINAKQARLLSADRSMEGFDIGMATLRGMPPAIVEYMSRIGVVGLVSTPIFVDRRLWGFMSIHSFSPIALPSPRLRSLELIGQYISSKVENVVQTRRAALMIQTVGIAASVASIEDRTLSASALWPELRNDLRNLLPNDGLAYLAEGKTETLGDAPDPETCRRIANLALSDRGAVFATSDLDALIDDAGDIGGALVIPLSDAPKIDLVYLRRITQRAASSSADSGGIEAEFFYGLESWSDDDLAIADNLRAGLRRALETRRQLYDNRQRLGILVRELNHRVRNILALIQSLTRESLKSSLTLEEYAAALRTRIGALATAHDMLTADQLRGVGLRQLIEVELSPYLSPAEMEEAITGPDVFINAEATPITTLVVHELTSNAAKYGALSSEGGKIEINWRMKDKGLALRWCESGGPPVTGPIREGFGRALIENAFPYELEGRARLMFRPDGVVAELWAPETVFETNQETDAKMKPRAPMTIARPAIRPDLGLALIVEDDFLLASAMTKMLRRIGFSDVKAVSRPGQALEWLAANRPDFSLLDVELRGETVAPVAEELRRRRARFAFATGYGSAASEIIGDFNAPILAKPVDELDVLRALSGI